VLFQGIMNRAVVLSSRSFLSKTPIAAGVGRLSVTTTTPQSYLQGTLRPIGASASSVVTTTQAFARRELSSYVLDGFGGGGRGGGGGGTWQWPITKSNTIFNIVPQGHKYVVERFGKLHSVQDSGWFLAIPLVDQIAYVVDIRERAMDIPPQSAITRDNVSVEVSGNLFIKFQDPVAAAYGALNPLYSVTQVRISNLLAIRVTGGV
jgi:hypothetical protein